MVPTQPAASTPAMMIPYQWTLIGPSWNAMGSITAAILTRFAAEAPDRLIGRRRARRGVGSEALQLPEHREEARPHHADHRGRHAADQTAGTTPHQAAVTPDSNSPSSFDAPMNTAFTALTRPRMTSGVCSCTSRCRTNMLTMSEAPSTPSARATARTSSTGRTPRSRRRRRTRRRTASGRRRFDGRSASTPPASAAPTAGAARRNPRPTGPTCRTSLAKAGSRAGARRTARRTGRATWSPGWAVVAHEAHARQQAAHGTGSAARGRYRRRHAGSR